MTGATVAEGDEGDRVLGYGRQGGSSQVSAQVEPTRIVVTFPPNPLRRFGRASATWNVIAAACCIMLVRPVAEAMSATWHLLWAAVLSARPFVRVFVDASEFPRWMSVVFGFSAAGMTIGQYRRFRWGGLPRVFTADLQEISMADEGRWWGRRHRVWATRDCAAVGLSPIEGWMMRSVRHPRTPLVWGYKLVIDFDEATPLKLTFSTHDRAIAEQVCRGLHALRAAVR